MKNSAETHDVTGFERRSGNTNGSAHAPLATVIHRHPEGMSQYGQDAFVLDVLFPDITGYYVDVGALTGKSGSNTWLLEKYGWRGICVEPHPTSFAELVKARPGAYCVNLAISDSDSEAAEFLRVDKGPTGRSGLRETFRSDAFAKIERHPHEAISVPTARLDGVLEKAAVPPFLHYLDIDVEGHELRVLHGIDFDRWSFGVIGIETRPGFEGYEEICDFLNDKGYGPVAQLGADTFFMRRRDGEAKKTPQRDTKRGGQIDILERHKRVYRKIIDRVPDMHALECPVCSFYGPFDAFGTSGRANARCPSCGSLERTRLMIRMIEKNNYAPPRSRVLEVAPFVGTADYFRYRRDCDFVGLDIDAEKMIGRGIPCIQADLCKTLPEGLEGFDLIVNSHVMEHLSCDAYGAIERITSLLKPGGVHLLAVPFGGLEDISHLEHDWSPQKRLKLLGHPDHYHAFGHEEFPRRLAAMFGSRFKEIDTSRHKDEAERYGLGLELRANRVFRIRGRS